VKVFATSKVNSVVIDTTAPHSLSNQRMRERERERERERSACVLLCEETKKRCTEKSVSEMWIFAIISPRFEKQGNDVA
jgi:hypothetical protein